MPVSWTLEVVEGPRQGDKIKLKTKQVTLLGRSKHGIDLLDPRVSTRHAQLSYDEDRFWIEDLTSATGTLVDGKPVDTDPVALAPGTRILLGDSVLVLHESRKLLPQWVYWAALVLLVISTPGFISLIWTVSLPWTATQPYILAPNPVRGKKYAEDPIKVPLDRCFMRETFADASNATIRRVTDWDADGTDEIWIESNREGWERVYTFDSNGDWRLLGELPKGCQHSPNGQGFRDLSCGNLHYQFQHGGLLVGKDRCARTSSKGRYEVTTLSGAVVWMPNNEEGQPSRWPRPYHLVLKDERPLATWLGERGVEEPVHFVICEDAIPGMAAQAFTAAGHIKSLEPGCLTSVNIEGPMKTDRYKMARPVAMAFTEAGRKLLIEQVSVYWGGSELRHFVREPQLSMLRLMDETPQQDTATLLAFDPSPDAPGRFFEPIPSQDKPLQPPKSEYLRPGAGGSPPAARADVWRWTQDTGRGVLTIPCGDDRLVIEPMGWKCQPPCTSTTPFLKVSVVRTNESWNVPYRGGVHLHQFNGIEVEANLRGGPVTVHAQIVAATIAARSNQSCFVKDEPAVPLIHMNMPVIQPEYGENSPLIAP
ncbi:MAG: pSer/pThr/pTyr-binding forkhead associated (FHA) protein [Kiritimatiellia bacterium]|jgi:pSer/pThr/pTyr-binding forkhead associated (FHA) protein